MSEFVEQKKAEIRDRLRELAGAASEHARLEAALDALDSDRLTFVLAEGRRQNRGAGTRADQALDVVAAEPGLTTGEVAQRLAIATNYLYRVLPALERDGRLEKRGHGWYLPGPSES